MKVKLLSEKASLILIWVGLTVLAICIFLFLYHTSIFSLDQQIDSQKFDHFGSLIGGLVGSLWTLSSIILFYVALSEQRKSIEHQREAINDQKAATLINSKALEAQVKSLQIQTQEFELQREELKQTREVFSEQSLTLKLQQFESTFFNLLNLHHQIVDSIDVESKELKDFDTEKFREVYASQLLKSRDCFPYFYVDFKMCFRELMQKNKHDNTDEGLKKLIDGAFHTFFVKYQSDLGHYYRNLYNILKFIDKKNPGDKFFYSNLLRAQLSSHELLLLFYNCLSHYGDKKFKPLIEEYHFLQNLAKPALIDIHHLDLYNSKAFGRPNEV